MALHRILRGPAILGSIRIGGGSSIKKITCASATIDPASLAATTRGAYTFTVTGAAVGDRIIVEPPATLNDDLIFVGAAVTGANEATVYIYNPTAGALDQASASWNYTWIDLT